MHFPTVLSQKVVGAAQKRLEQFTYIKMNLINIVTFYRSMNNTLF